MADTSRHNLIYFINTHLKQCFIIKILSAN